jgi:hypothetical protein
MGTIVKCRDRTKEPMNLVRNGDNLPDLNNRDDVDWEANEQGLGDNDKWINICIKIIEKEK